MNRTFLTAIALSVCVSMLSCDDASYSPEVETTATSFNDTSESVCVTIPTAEVTTVETTTEETTTEETTTEETTTEETTTEETTTAETTTAETTAATTTSEPPMHTSNFPAASVLFGEYTYGGAPVIENRDGFTYVNGILIVNKTYSLPSNYNPGGLISEASAAFGEMQAAAREDGIYLEIISGYRSYNQQSNTYNSYVARDGKAEADRYSARPGHSEHQTGYAMDINSLYQSFANTAEGKWLADNCAEYGFIIRYPAGKEHITGYMYEPWHVRYVGKELARQITDSGLCLEEFLGITSVYTE